MVFYGKKKSQLQHQDPEYRSIKEQILKQLGERITPVYEKSLATIFSDLGDIILIGTQSILNMPQNFKTTNLYRLYKDDQQTFKSEFQPETLWYHSLSKQITQNKFYIIKNFSIQQRIFFLNTTVFLMSVLSTRLNRGFGSKLRGLMKTSLVGYGLGGIFIVPEIYNSLMTQNIV